MLLLVVILTKLIAISLNHPLNEEFEKFAKHFNKSYISTIEYNRRLSIFETSIKRIKWLNDQRIHNQSAKYGITQYSDLTPLEFKQLIIKRQVKEEKQLYRTKRSIANYKSIKDKIKDLPKYIDWRNKKAVTDVSDQGKCGACWAYSTVETIESMVSIKTKVLQRYSVQQLVDCADEDNQGCDGGDTCSALVWMADTKIKLQTAKQYPNKDKRGECEVKNPKHGVMIASNFTCDNFANKEEEIVKYLAKHGPLVAAVNAESWQDYLGGIIQYHCDNDVNHAIQIVGYDFRGDIPYYILRNTWGKSFGIDGYLHLAVGNNLCGIAEEISALDVIIV